MRALISCVALVSACSVGIEQAGARPAGGLIHVKAVEVQASDRAVEVNAVGTLVADETVTLRPEISGQIVAVSFEDGDTVTAGTVLARLKDDSQKATLAEAEANLTLASAQLVRVAALSDRGNSSADQLDQATATRDLAQARRDIAVGALRRTVIRAPFAGKLSARLITLGAQVDPTTAVTTLVDADPLQVEVDLPESVQPWLTFDTPVQVSADAIGASAAKVVYIAPTITPESRTVRIRANLTEPSNLAPGLTVQAHVEVHPPAPVITVPAEAVTNRAEGPMVWVVQDGKVTVRQITTGARLAADITVLTGLQPGETVVTEGLVRLREGSAVTIDVPVVTPDAPSATPAAETP